jgi:D-serine deaminase-like pyridoxal phosphate-dependent protein
VKKADIETPAVLIDADRLERNIRLMAEAAGRMGVALRPHFKTHKTIEIARMQLAAGAVGITCAKTTEAEVLVGAGVTDVFIANEVVGPAKVERLRQLARRATVSVGIDDLAQAEPLAQAFARESRPLPVFIEVDTGLGRCGLPPASGAHPSRVSTRAPGQPVLALAEQLARLPGLELRGIFTHEGHVHRAREKAELEAMALAAGRAMVETAQLLRSHGIPCEVVSVGTTPAALITPTVPGVTEARPGSYVFYDRCHLRTWSATEEDLALTVLATVISRPARERVVLDAGSKVLSSDHVGTRFDTFGLIRGHPDWRFVAANEEHGMVAVPPEAEVAIGDRVEVFPNHNCVVMNLADEVYVARGENVTARWRVAARGASR